MDDHGLWLEMENVCQSSNFASKSMMCKHKGAYEPSWIVHINQ